jgi:hypothetical protein
MKASAEHTHAAAHRHHPPAIKHTSELRGDFINHFLTEIIHRQRQSRGESSESKAMGRYLEVACKPKFWGGTQGNNSSAQPSTIIVIEAFRLCAFAPPNSPLD